MKKWTVRFFLLAVLAAVGLWGWRVWFPSPEQVIRKRLTELARAASVAPHEAPLAQFANAQEVASFFTTNALVTVDVRGHSPHTFSGRAELLQAAMGARTMLPSLTVKLVGVKVQVGKDRQTATVHFTAEANIGGEKESLVQELSADLQKVKGRWLIHRAETVKTLR